MITRRTFMVLTQSAVTAMAAHSALAADSSAPLANGVIASQTGKLVLPNRTLPYRLTLDATTLVAKDGTPESRLVTFAYTATGAGNPNTRPLVFAFNGGPGGSSVHVHLGVLGPRRLFIPSNPDAPFKAPYHLENNAESILAEADLVLIDPVGTGYSRLLDASKTADYYSVDGDGQYLADFVKRWMADHGRMQSPIYIFGESYGCQRAVAMAKALTKDQQDSKIDLRGLVLLSESISVLETVQRRSNIVGYTVGFETIAATGWYFKKVEAGGLDLPAFLDKVRAFTADTYLPALYQGHALPADRRAAVADQLSRYSGVPASTWIEKDFMISKEDYRRLLFKDKGLITGLYDTRYLGPNDKPNADPSQTGLDPAVDWGINTILHDELKVATTETYRVSDRPPPTRWTYGKPITPTNGDSYRTIDYPVDLMETMKARPQMRVFVCGGYYDTAASIGADEFLLRRNNFPMDRVILRHYVGGHMFYTDEDSRKKFSQELAGFVTKT